MGGVSVSAVLPGQLLHELVEQALRPVTASETIGGAFEHLQAKGTTDGEAAAVMIKMGEIGGVRFAADDAGFLIIAHALGSG